MDWENLYRKNYKILMVVPMVLFLVSALMIWTHIQKTGEIVDQDIDFKGGSIATLSWTERVNIDEIETKVSEAAGGGVSVRSLKDYSGKQTSLIFQADKEVDPDKLKSAIQQAMGITATMDNYSVRIVGPAMGSAFLQTTQYVVIIGFILTGVVIFFTFKIPEIAVGAVVCGLLNIIAAVAGMDVLGLKLNAGTLAALLMFLASSIDDNILIISRVLENRKHAVKNALIASRTGGFMVSSSLLAFIVLRLTTTVPLFQDFTTVLIVGLIADKINTWFQNTGLVLWYVERKFGKSAL